jgi:hypothetical protein
VSQLVELQKKFKDKTIKKVRELAKLNYSLHYYKLCSKPLEHSTTIPLYEGILVDLDH